mmetsp:Transcript_83569/g.190643  ORF Transcript_83569/g.190643 Transcript_83569/m.190643 type:complete len:854 (-) Transcript_83569:211-2772(-)|eukprot:CAMPEP_0204355228 /NCGR_PEP_ID=MMETSP0469-20131031/33982_1 /ASSEMBLY_ACC=CAM_ASM_000384 /TAXON_ID=2969 /ORGANISM="Oxyrrhis marina" /LENGTH=853 /DNA_ID=CAMNT_0051342437 /DNA_START=51 /DNA_END=2612 /DNA_ORIENTATION=-
MFASEEEDELATSRHRILKWVPVVPGQEDDDVDLDKVAKDNGVPRNVFLAYIVSEMSEEESFKTLPFAVLLVVIFALSFSLHDQAQKILDVQDAVRFDIEENANFAFNNIGTYGAKNIYDVNQRGDFFSWTRMGLMTLVLQTSPNLAEWRENDETWNTASEYFLNYNRVIGGIRMRQARGPKQSLPSSEAWLYDKPLTPVGTTLDLNQHLRPENFQVIAADTVFDESRTVWLLQNESQAHNDRVLVEMEDSGWFDDQTAQVELSFTTYNPHFDTLTVTRIVVLQSRSGHFWRSVVPQSVFMNHFPDDDLFYVKLVVDCIFCFQVLFLLILEGRELAFLCVRYRSSGILEALGKYASWWNVIDWIAILYGSGVAIVFLYLNSQARDLGDELRSLRVGAASWIDVVELNRVVERTIDLIGSYKSFRTFAACYPLIIMVRLFEAFGAQPRLAVLTKTLKLAATDLFHFGIVFLATFGSYAVMAHALFGRDLHDFATMPRSFQTCFLVLMGDFDLREMMQVGRSVAFMWFLSFMCLVLLVMLNMLLAIIMDTYTNVKGQVTSTETLAEQATEFFVRWRRNRRKERVSLSQIWQCYSESLGEEEEAASTMGGLDFGPLETVESVQATVGGIRPQQALRLLRNAIKEYKQDYDSQHGLSIADAMSVVNKIHYKLDAFIVTSRRGEQARSAGRRHSHVDLAAIARLQAAGAGDDCPAESGDKPTPPVAASAMRLPVRASEVGRIEGGKPGGLAPVSGVLSRPANGFVSPLALPSLKPSGSQWSLCGVDRVEPASIVHDGVVSDKRNAQLSVALDSVEVFALLRAAEKQLSSGNPRHTPALLAVQAASNFLAHEGGTPHDT